MSDFYKFKSLDGTNVYINIKLIYSIEKGPRDGFTKIISTNGANHVVEKHIEEVLAILEDRDPTIPAILFGKKKK